MIVNVVRCALAPFEYTFEFLYNFGKMNSEDEEIMIKLRQELMDYLDAKFIVDFLYNHKVLAVEDYNITKNM